MLEKVETVYKLVVRNTNGQLESSWVGGKAKVIYTPGEVVRAPEWLEEKGLTLWACRQPYHAFAMASKDLPREIWEAEATGVKQVTYIPYDILYDSDELILIVTIVGNDETRGYSVSGSVVFCDTIKLTRKLREDEWIKA